MKKLLIAAAVSTSLLGCSTLQTTDPLTGETKFNNTTKIATVGALGGTLVALATGGDKKDALVGAALGGAAGAGVGYYMDRQEAVLREKMKASGVSVTRIGDKIVLNMPGNITFDSGRSELKGSFLNTLSGVVEVAKEFDETQLEIKGHADSTGSASRNLALSTRRAQSVASYLMTSGISNARVTAYGAGSSEPVASNATTKGRAANRRVEIILKSAS